MKNLLVNTIAMMILCAVTGLAAAGDYGYSEAKSWSNKGMEKNMMSGKHAMSGTIETVDPKTGWVKLKTSGGDMTLHFPAQSIMDLKKGDVITVHLGFSKSEEMMKNEKMMDEKMKK